MTDMLGSANDLCLAIEKAIANHDTLVLIEIVSSLYSSNRMNDPRVFSLICELVKHDDSSLAGTAMAVLTEHGVENYLLSPPFFSLIIDENPRIRMRGFWCIRHLTTIDGGLRKAIIDSLASDDKVLREVTRQLIARATPEVKCYILNFKK